VTGEELLGPTLARTHRLVLRKLEGALDPACRAEGGVWDRWGAAQLLDTEIRPVIRVERELMTGLLQSVPPRDEAQLWALGELLEALGDRVCELGRTGQRPNEFARTAGKYRLALQHWCRAVENASGRLSRAAAPAGLLERLEELAGCASGRVLARA
jgi:hypothetical protein